MSVRPKKQLGQHFLADENILGVIERLAELGPDDVVLEIGPGLGVLTRRLAERAGHVHAVELDRSLAPHLAELAERPNVDLHWGDALQLDLAALDPTPTKLVANLPYNVATPIVAESLAGLPSLERWTVMVQREVADRFFAAPVDEGLRLRLGARPARNASAPASIRSPARSSGRPRTSTPPSSPSAACRCRRTSHGSSRSSRRRSPTAARRCRTRSRSQASPPASEAAAALAAIGRPPETRAEALEPREFVALAEAL